MVARRHSYTIPARLFLVSFFLYLSVAFAMAFRPNCGRRVDHPRWADGDALARAFIMEMKDDLAVYLTNMNAAIHGIGTSLKGNDDRLAHYSSSLSMIFSDSRK